ncbi:MAG: transglutaminase domain-containing protein [Candidatus Magasanikbacteria bacterium]
MNEERKIPELKDEGVFLEPVEKTGIFFDTLEKIKAYKKWKEEVDPDFRHIVEAKLQGKKIKIDKTNSPLVGEFYGSFQFLLANPDFEVGGLDIDSRVKRQLKNLQKVKINDQGDTVNIFKLMTNSDIDFVLKQDFYNKKIKARVDWLEAQDKKDVEKYSTKNEKTEVTGSNEDDEYEPHRQASQEQEGEPSESIATIFQYFGGYYKDGVFPKFDSQTLKWSKDKTTFQELPEQKIDQDKKRMYRTAVKSGKVQIIKMPYNWAVDQANVKWSGDQPDEFNFFQDQNGLSYIKVRGDAVEYELQIDIGLTKDNLVVVDSDQQVKDVADIFSEELNQFIIDIKTARIPEIQKARKLVSFIRSHLEYDKDDVSLDAFYKQDRSQYFVKMWENKKAKCDEANTMAVRALTKAGFNAQLISGHSVQAKSKKGEALLLDNNRHAWLEVLDKENNKWVRLDATPKGDPNVDEEDQEEDLGLSEGDYSEQSADLMSEEEMEKILKELEKKEKEKSQKPEIIFAREAGCTPEEAIKVLDKIKDLREKYKKELESSNNHWKKVLRKNLIDELEYSGPVRQSEGDDLDDPVEARIDVRVGEDDPSGFEKEFIEQKQEKIFGGYEVYIMADMSGSMDWDLNGIKKSEAQRDMVFLLLDSIMRSAVMSRKAEKNLKTPMPNKVCLVVFGAKTEIVLPVTDKWGPAEQIKAYKSLDQSANGSTPDDKALNMIKRQIEIATEEEEKSKKKVSKNNKDNWKMHRFVIATADGGSDNYSQVKLLNNELQNMGIPVDLFLISDTEDENLLKTARQTYQSATQVSDVRDLAGQCLDTLTDRIKEVYGK